MPDEPLPWLLENQPDLKELLDWWLDYRVEVKELGIERRRFDAVPKPGPPPEPGKGKKGGG